MKTYVKQEENLFCDAWEIFTYKSCLLQNQCMLKEQTLS